MNSEIFKISIYSGLNLYMLLTHNKAHLIKKYVYPLSDKTSLVIHHVNQTTLQRVKVFL